MKQAPLLPSPDKTPRVALGTDFRFFAGIGNKGIQDMIFEDPKGTQQILIHVHSPQDTTENFFLLYPSQVDSLGEVTAPSHDEISVKAGAYAPFRFSLFQTMMDRSVEPLLAILDDVGKDMWVCKESLRWLKRLRPDFEYDFAKPDSRGFRAWWDAEKGKLDIDAGFRNGL